jgi:hypothetical protein
MVRPYVRANLGRGARLVCAQTRGRALTVSFADDDARHRVRRVASVSTRAARHTLQVICERLSPQRQTEEALPSFQRKAWAPLTSVVAAGGCLSQDLQLVGALEETHVIVEGRRRLRGFAHVFNPTYDDRRCRSKEAEAVSFSF